MGMRLVTFLGLGSDTLSQRYQPCVYQIDGRDSPVTPNHDVATLMGASGPCSVVVMGTDKVRDAWFGDGALYEKTLREGLARAGVTVDVRVAFRLLPEGRTNDERWTQFTALTEALSSAPLTLPDTAGQAPLEHEAPTEVVLDITHGFRSQPFFAAAAVAFARSQRRRTRVEGPPIRILYAAFEAREKTRSVAPHGGAPPASNDEVFVSPVWDMTQMIDVLAWDAAIDGLMRYGRADDLEKLTREEQAKAMRMRGKHDAPPRLRALGDAARGFADGLATARIPQLLTDLAPRLARAIHESRGDVVRLVPPLAAQLDELERRARGIEAPSAISVDGVHAGLRLARLYLDLERFSEAAVALRESLVSHWGLQTLGEARPLQPDRGEPGQKSSGKAFNDQRHGHDVSFGKAAGDMGTEVSKLSFNLVGLRNDVEHGGFRGASLEGTVIRRELLRFSNEAMQVLGVSGAPTARPVEAPRTQVFVNLSNHPVATWTGEQVPAARALGVGEPVDLVGGMPLVDPEADDEAVAALARHLVERALAQGATAAHVAGESTLTVALVTRLRREGVRCFAATTHRVVEERPDEGGAVGKASVFRFVRWREYTLEG